MPTALIVDTSALYSYFNRSARDHERVAESLASNAGALVLSPYVAAELDYLVMTRLGVAAELRVLSELASGAFEFPTITPSDLLRMRALISRYDDQRIGLADASLVVLADHYSTNTLLTLDERHFSIIRPLNGDAFELLPRERSRSR